MENMNSTPKAAAWTLSGLWACYAACMGLLVVFVQLLKVWPANPLFTLTSAVFFLFSINHALLNLGTRRALQLFVLTFTISLVFEGLNLVTGGWIFGPLQYTSKLGFKLFGLIPLLIPLTWFTVGYLSLCIAHRIFGGWPGTLWRRARLAALAAVVMTCWDLGMDPVMVAKGHWVWLQPGLYFGIPLHNFAGWWLTAFCFYLAWLALPAGGKAGAENKAEAGHPLLAPTAYAITCISMTIANVDMGHMGPAIIGFVAMGTFALYWLREAGLNNRRRD
jgi:uncharacterized membrane protein